MWVHARVGSVLADQGMPGAHDREPPSPNDQRAEDGCAVTRTVTDLEPVNLAFGTRTSLNALVAELLPD